MTLPTGYRIVAERAGDAAAIEALLDRAFGAGRRLKRSYSFRDGLASEPALRLVALDPAGALGDDAVSRGQGHGGGLGADAR